MHGTHSLFFFCLFPFSLVLRKDSRSIDPWKPSAVVMDEKSAWNKAFQCVSIKHKAFVTDDVFLGSYPL
jgi:hypothetical protein